MIFQDFNLFFVKHFVHTSRRQILTRIILGAVKPVTSIIWIIQGSWTLLNLLQCLDS